MWKSLAGAMLPILIVGHAQGQIIPPGPRFQVGYGRGFGVGPGSTVAGDYLRGVGIAAYGMGIYNERTAVANRINAETSIMVNEYLWSVVENENRKNAEHRKAKLAREAEASNQIRERIHNNPNVRDVDKGDALNAVLEDLLAPNVSDSVSRYAKIPLDANVIRHIPFKRGDKGEVFSMGRLSLKGKKMRAVAFQDPRFHRAIQNYQLAVDNALELAMDENMTEKAIRDIEKAFDDLENLFMRTPHVLDPRHQKEYAEGKNQLDKMRRSPDLFMGRDLQPVFREIDSYSGTTVDDLRLFMRRHNLTFAPAETSVERELYPQLYQALVEHRSKTTIEQAR